LASPGAVSLASRLNASVIPMWRLERDSAHGPRQIHDESYVETRAARPRDWEEHLQVHQAVRELLNIATWQPFRYHQILVSRDDDPVRTIGDMVSERWCTVKTYALRANVSPQGNPRYWFGYGDIRSTGFRRWLKLRDKYKRATTPMLSLVASSRSELIESRLNQSSISLEALGYQLALDAGKSESAARKLTYEARLEIIANAIPVSPVMPDWSRRAADAYNGVKHANRAMPATRDMLRVLLENTLTFRVWAAHRLGVPTAIVSDAVDIDTATQTLKHSL
jgi:hypothetical protein